MSKLLCRTVPRRVFWMVSIVSALMILIWPGYFLSTRPARWTLMDWGYALPLLACVAVSVLAGLRVGYQSRACSGFLQSLAFLLLASGNYAGLREPVGVLLLWMSLLIVYTTTSIKHSPEMYCSFPTNLKLPEAALILTAVTIRWGAGFPRPELLMKTGQIENFRTILNGITHFML